LAHWNPSAVHHRRPFIIIDVGYTGSEAIGRLFARQIFMELIEAGVFSDDSETETEEGQGYKNL